MHCWARYLLFAVVSFLAIGQMGVACGQKGPLYLPDRSETEASGAPAAARSAPLGDDIPRVVEQPGDDIPRPSGD